MSPGIEIPICSSCGHAAFPPHLVCSRCGSRSWEPRVETTGTVQQATAVELRVGAPEDAEPIPLVSVGADAGPVVIARGEPGLRPGDRVDFFRDGRVITVRRSGAAA